MSPPQQLPALKADGAATSQTRKVPPPPTLSRPGARSSGRRKEAHDRGGHEDSANRRLGRSPRGLGDPLGSARPRALRRGGTHGRRSPTPGAPPCRRPAAWLRASAPPPAARPPGRGAASRGEGALCWGPRAGVPRSARVPVAAASPDPSVSPGPLSMMWAQLHITYPHPHPRPGCRCLLELLRLARGSAPFTSKTGGPGRLWALKVPVDRAPTGAVPATGPGHSRKASRQPHPQDSGACSATPRS